MNIFKKADKVLASFGNIKAMQRNHVDTFTENKIKNTKGFKIAEGKHGQLIINFQKLAGYEFLQLSIISNFSIKTEKGVQLLFDFYKNPAMSIKSDTQEIESEFSNVSNRYITLIDFVIENKEKKQLLSTDLKSVTLFYKNGLFASLDLMSIRLNNKEQQVLFPTVYYKK